MAIDTEKTQGPISENTAREPHSYRFHVPSLHLQSVFGDDWFALKAEAFARFFGTPTFLITQTVIVGVWILLNVLGLTTFDIYPFILLNLAFSLQAAYAAHSYCWRRPARRTATRRMRWPTRNIAKRCIMRARSGQRLRRRRQPSW